MKLNVRFLYFSIDFVEFWCEQRYGKTQGKGLFYLFIKNIMLM